MTRTLLTIGRLVGALGVLLAVFAGAVRVSGQFWVGGFSSGTLLLGGMAAMMIGCLSLLAALTAERSANGS